MKAASLVRPLVRQLHGYVPGEQPKIKGLVKLNTNENPYPPSPKVLQAVRTAADHRLRLYPNPTADGLREKLARLHKCGVGNIIVGNGSDELLALATRAFVEPADTLSARAPSASLGVGESAARKAARFVEQGLSSRTVQYFNPSYSLYPVLADIAGAVRNPVPLGDGFALPDVASLRRGGMWDFQAALSFVTTPNAPSGRGYGTIELEALCRVSKGVVVLDEAYVDFAQENALSLALKYPHVLVSRTFSKAYSLCFQRVGYFIGSEVLIDAMHRIRDSYNANGLGQVAACATLDDLPYYRRNFSRIIATRERLRAELANLGFEALPSSANFVFVKPPGFPAEQWLNEWRARKILVRWWSYPEVREYLRITVGTDSEIDQLLRATRSILKHSAPGIRG